MGRRSTWTRRHLAKAGPAVVADVLSAAREQAARVGNLFAGARRQRVTEDGLRKAKAILEQVQRLILRTRK
jgi:phage gp37-like protein